MSYGFRSSFFFCMILKYVLKQNIHIIGLLVLICQNNQFQNDPCFKKESVYFLKNFNACLFSNASNFKF